MNTIRENTKFLIKAARNGNTAEVERLIPLSNPKTRHNQALQLAAEEGHTECVKLLIPVSNPKADRSEALANASYWGHTECVELLLPVSDAKADNSKALQMAAYNGHKKCVDLLFDVSDPHHALHQLQSKCAKNPEKWQYLEEKIAIQQRAVLSNEVAKSQNKIQSVARKI